MNIHLTKKRILTFRTQNCSMFLMTSQSLSLSLINDIYIPTLQLLPIVSVRVNVNDIIGKWQSMLLFIRSLSQLRFSSVLTENFPS
uniref:Uncharacterized protein n=1 Tax=Lepeophtheirus salmonis TaxID=72036 RepID=A0A0K2SZK1_LEPSM